MRRYYAVTASLLAVGTLTMACGDTSEHGPDLFPAAPDPCSLLSAATVANVANGPTQIMPSKVGPQSSCSWQHDVDQPEHSTLPQPGRRDLEVSVIYYPRQDGQSGADRAARTFEMLENDPGMGPNDPLPGVGDESYAWFGKYGVPEEGVEFRTSNVTVTVLYGGFDVDQNGQAVDPPKIELQPGATQVALEVVKNLDGEN